MANSSNALWIGGIVIVAALTVVELMSSREKGDTTNSVNTATANGSAAPISVQQDAGQIAMGTASTLDTTNATEAQGLITPTNTDAHSTEFDMDTEYASDLIIDLDNPGANVAAITKSLLHKPEGEKTKRSETAMSNNDATSDTLVDETINLDTAAATVSVTPSALSGQDKNAIKLEQTVSAQSTKQPEVEAGSTPTTIAKHLAAAEKALKDLRMTTPSGDNAYEHYQAVLKIDPSNVEARSGIQKMVDMYIYFAEKAIADGKKNNARIYLQRAENLAPGSPKLKNLRAELN
ncbi:hypothetical protein [Nitrosomonas sp.]|uniref:hypothetical protein n=1 Tax=Nitrosomonas sp. TaxID=42353 RepID=UPI001DCE0E86|nr:hypothetical protein [Nitrosomonas sp.]MCB1949269.1 hypothetical protein [Nitrosomonas sp.]